MCEQWTHNLLRDLFTLEYGASLSDAVRRPGQVPVYGSNGCVGFHDVSLCLGPGIIVGRKGSVGQVCWSKDDFWPIDTTYYVQPKNNIEFRWLYWLLLHCNLSKLNSSTGVPGLNRNDAYSQSVNCPPLVEQRAIAAILDSVDEAIRQTEGVIAKLRQVKMGMLHDLLTCGLDENGELRDPIRHPEQFKDSPLGRIPREWEINSLGSLIQELGAGVSVNAWDKPTGSGGTGVLKTSCVFSGSFFPEENKTVFPRDRGRVSCPVKANSIILSRMNTPLLVGESGYVEADYPDLYLPDRLWQTVMREEKNCSVKWLSYVLNWDPVRKLIRDIATGTSGSMKNISKGGLLAIDIRIPRTEEQTAISDRIRAFDKVLAEESKKLAKLNQAKHGLMHDLLTGTVRVPTNLLEATP